MGAYFGALLLGGMVGVAQYTVLCFLLPPFLPNLGWLLVLIPFGSTCGVLFTRALIWLVDKKSKASTGVALCGSTLCGLPIALAVPIMFFSLVPSQQYLYACYFVVFGIAWSGLLFLIYDEAKKTRQ
jgi:hypothetical protein